MFPDLQRLIRLQEVETRAADAHQCIASAPARVAQLDARLTAARDAVAAATRTLADNQTARRTLEKDQLAVQQRLSKYKEQLMDVKTNHEYHAMQQQMAATTVELGRVEEQILVNMMAADEVNVTLKTAQAQLTSDEASIGAERQTIEADALEARDAVAETAAERASLVATIDRAVLAIFEHVLKWRHGTAMASALGGLCTSCRVRLRPMIYDQVRRNDSIVQCDSCQRILYTIPATIEPAAGTTPAPPAPSSSTL